MSADEPRFFEVDPDAHERQMNEQLHKFWREQNAAME